MPDPLTPGDTTFVIAPSSPYSRDELWRGLAWLRERYRIVMAPGALDRQGYLAGTDERRRDELLRAIAHPFAKAIIAVRGGYGAMRVVRDLPWPELARNPKWIVGFSDISALHAMAWRAGMASVHGPNVTGLGLGVPPRVRASWIAALERPRALRVWRGLRVLRSGVAEGVAVGGNLSVLCGMAVAGCLQFPRGSIVLLEDVGEAAYRVDRMLTSLLLGGYLAQAAAVIFGGFDRCGTDEPSGTTIERVLLERTASLGVPVLSGAPFGHGAHNEAFVLGGAVRVQRDEVRLGVG